MKKFFSALTVAALAIAATLSCEKQEPAETTPTPKEEVALTGISLSQSEVGILVGNTATLKVVYAPSNATEKPAAAWASSDEAVATVEGGVVSGLADGTATITATVGEFSATCEVTVTSKAIPATAITLSHEVVVLENGESQLVRATVTPANTTDVLTWTISGGEDPIATVDGGLIKSLKVGVAIVKVAAGDIEKEVALEVVEDQVHATGITLTPAKAAIFETYTSPIEAALAFDAADDASKNVDEIVWAVSDESVIALNEEHTIISALKAGTATITATVKRVTASTVSYEELKAECEVTVSEIPVGAGGLAAQITGTSSKPSSFTVTLDKATVTYVNSSNIYIEDETGAILYYKKNHGLDVAGKTLSGTITGNIYNGLPEVTVVDDLTALTIEDAAEEFKPAEVTLEDLAAASAADYAALLSRKVVVKDVEIVSVFDNRNATLGHGEVTFNLYDSKNNSTLKRGVVGDLVAIVGIYKEAKQLLFWEDSWFTQTSEDPTFPATAISLDKEELEVAVGATATLVATPDPVDTTDELVWSTSNAEVATVANGVVTGVAVGEATITVTAGEVSATCKVTVSEAAVAGWVMAGFDEIKDGDVVVIARVGANAVHAMSNNNGTASAPSAVALTVSAEALASEPDANLKWTVSMNEGFMSFSPTGSGDVLYCTNSNNGMRVGDNTDNSNFTVTSEGYLYNVATSRYIGVYNNQDWRCYTSIISNIKDQSFCVFIYR